MASMSTAATGKPATLRKIMRPVISTDIMGNRNVEVKAVGAWAEPALCYESRLRTPDAVKAAELEEEKIRTMQAEKAARLRQFQHDVKRRVRQINKTKRRQQIEKDCEQMEKQHELVRSSLRASDCLTERKDRVVSQSSTAISLHPSQSQSHTTRLSEDTGTGADTVEQGRQKKMFEKHNRQVHGFTSAARQKLSGKQMDNRDTEDILPGGHWASRDWATQESGDREGVEEECSTERMAHLYSDDDDSQTLRLRQAREIDERMTRFFPLPSQTSVSPPFPYASHSEEYRRDAEEEEKENGQGDGPEERVEALEDDEEYKARLQRVKAGLRSVGFKTHRGGRTSHRKKGAHRPTSAPDLRAGANEYQEKRRQGQQKLTYRRLYSDLERQAVRDAQRHKQQRAQIRKLKQEKEEQRRQEEESARRLVEPRDPVTGETSVEADLRQQLERSHLQEVIQEHEEQRQRQREMARYLEALRKNLREKMNKQGLELPSLCCCGETLWDTHPDTCANNCFYYKNHRAYARALQSLLASSMAG